MASSGEALVALVLDDDPMRRIAFANAYGSLLHLPKVSEERDRASATLETAIAKGDADLARIRGLEEAIDELAGVPLRAGEGETLRELRKELEVLRT